ncbi:hypothetical protein [Pyxidicoccus xibeiensis]|uniref:hypothetical protein n=1 Tax=Pyxidicoccus xibeiensis TaxID=2906759 RepID=UPI0020A6EE3D|nr:hypothetical protein [Pyxidicoccus xibeiensis]MCP3139320.1 hypothetical protein [Pyxidicoccus xibeiensis]
MDRHLARTNPRLYAARWLSADEEGHTALLRALPPDDLALHVEALLAALTQPPSVIGEGRLTVDLRVDGLDEVSFGAFHQEDGSKRKRYQVLSAAGLPPAAARPVVEALWAANARLGRKPAYTHVTAISWAGLWGEDDPYKQEDEIAFDLRLYDRLLGVLDAVFSGLPLRRAELQGYEAAYRYYVELPGGRTLPDYSQPEPGNANLHLFWETPDGGEAEGLVPNRTYSNASRDALVAWSERTVRARRCPLWQRWQDRHWPSVLETPA